MYDRGPGAVDASRSQSDSGLHIVYISLKTIGMMFDEEALMRKLACRRIGLLLALIVVGSLFAGAQIRTAGRMSGVVKDPQGAVVPGATVQAKSETTGAEFEAVTNDTGAWTIPSVAPGTYTVNVSAIGFKTSSYPKVSVGAGGESSVDAVLQIGITETVVVTASRKEETVVNAPAAVSVVDDKTIRDAPTQNFGDLLRTIPGVNVMQISARDFNIVPRAASVNPASGQLVMIDGRTITQDYFGYVAWDMNPTSLNDVKQMEVLRGPASAVWGANAMNGVVDIVTKSPREMSGTTFTFGGGAIDRTGGVAASNPGTLSYMNATHGQIINDRWSFKLTGGYFRSDPFVRPTGNVPGSNTPYPSFPNYATKQPKGDARVDYDFPDGRQHLSFSGGGAATGGVFHTGLGPFRLDDGARIVYGRFAYSRDALSIKTFVNLWKAGAFSLLALGPQGPLNLSFDNRTWDIDVSNTSTVHAWNLFTYGGNYRKNWFDITMAPGGRKRDEGGAFIQDEMLLSDHFRWIVGVRVDKFEILDHAVVSPRTSFILKPVGTQSLRLSYSRAYRAPSMFNNYLDTWILQPLPLNLINPQLQGFFIFPVHGVGSLNLKEQNLDSYEVGYSGIMAKGRLSTGLTFYLTEGRREMFLGQTASYTSQNPPPNWPLPPYILDLLVAGSAFGCPGCGLPSVLGYQNLGTVRNKGVELSMDARLHRYVSAFANYSYQAKPDPKDFSISLINLPPKNRFNAGLSVNHTRFLADLAVIYVDKAYWRDVTIYNGWSDSYTQVNTTVGVRFGNGKYMLMMKVNNLGNEKIQNHVFGDLLKRQIIGELRIRL